MGRARRSSSQTVAVLRVFLQQPGKWRYGYDLSKETELKSGSLYPILMRMGDRGFLESSWQDSLKPGRPPRHTYRLTKAGLVFAREQMAPLPSSLKTVAAR